MAGSRESNEAMRCSLSPPFFHAVPAVPSFCQSFRPLIFFFQVVATPIDSFLDFFSRHASHPRKLEWNRFFLLLELLNLSSSPGLAASLGRIFSLTNSPDGQLSFSDLYLGVRNGSPCCQASRKCKVFLPPSDPEHLLFLSSSFFFLLFVTDLFFDMISHCQGLSPDRNSIDPLLFLGPISYRVRLCFPFCQAASHSQISSFRISFLHV